MKSTLLLVLLLMVSGTCAQSRAHVTVNSDLSQFTEYRQITVSCEHSSGEWAVWRYTIGDDIDQDQVLSQCGDGWGDPRPSACIVLTTKRSDTGVYWCESKHGECSKTINITVGGAVILQSPVHPVMEGDDVPLTCTPKIPSSNLSAGFYKDGSFIRTEPTGHMTIHHVSRSDEGLYYCKTSRDGDSPSSWLGMKDDSPPASLSVSPDSLQLHEYENIILTCGDNFHGWRIMRAVNTTKLQGKLILQTCGLQWGSATNDNCTLKTIKKTDSGVYWCESPARQRSNSVHLTVVDEGPILRIPILPLRKGENVTLTCKNKTSSLPADFYKDGSLIRTEPTGHMTLYRVSRSDVGLYKCNIKGHGESPSSWLFVLDPQDPASFTWLSVLKGICYFLKIAPYCISTYFMVPLLRQMLTGRKPAVLREDGEEADQPYDDVITEHHF